MSKESESDPLEVRKRLGDACGCGHWFLEVPVILILRG